MSIIKKDKKVKKCYYCNKRSVIKLGTYAMCAAHLEETKNYVYTHI